MYTHQMIVVFENNENLLDFNYIGLKFNSENDKDIQISFSQAREVFPRMGRHQSDPIAQCIIRIMKKNYNGEEEHIVYANVRRQSGCVDLYSNMMFKQQVVDSKSLKFS